VIKTLISVMKIKITCQCRQKNPVERSIDNNQLGHGSDMNLFRDSIGNALMDKVEQYQCLMIIKYSKFKFIMNHVTGSRLDEQ
jgi:hypothetical protein